MKTIREIIQFGGSLESVVVELEAREKERDKERADGEELRKHAERERVKGIVQFVLLDAKVNTQVLIDAIYPPPKPEKDATILVKLPAGAYWVKGMDGLNPHLPIFIRELNVEPNKLGDYVMVPPNPFHSPPPKPEKLPDGYYWYKFKSELMWRGTWIENHVPSSECEYRRWNDPPPEVTGNGEAITLNWLKSTNAELVDLTWQEPHPGDIRIGNLYLYGDSFHGRWLFRVYQNCGECGKAMETRGDIRRLCSALGIELKEGGA